jgi:transcriptional regulator
MDTRPDTVGNLRPILLAVLASGMKQAEVARRLNLTRASVNSAAHQSEKPWMPSYETGVLLMNLHAEIAASRQEAQQLPEQVD